MKRTASEAVIKAIQIHNSWAKIKRAPFFYIFEFPGESFGANQVAYYKIEIVSSEVGYHEHEKEIVVNDHSRRAMIRKHGVSRFTQTTRQTIMPPEESEMREMAYMDLMMSFLNTYINHTPKNPFYFSNERESDSPADTY